MTKPGLVSTSALITSDPFVRTLHFCSFCSEFTFTYAYKSLFLKRYSAIQTNADLTVTSCQLSTSSQGLLQLHWWWTYFQLYLIQLSHNSSVPKLMLYHGPTMKFLLEIELSPMNFFVYRYIANQPLSHKHLKP